MATMIEVITRDHEEWGDESRRSSGLWPTRRGHPRRGHRHTRLRRGRGARAGARCRRQLGRRVDDDRQALRHAPRVRAPVAAQGCAGNGCGRNRRSRWTGRHPALTRRRGLRLVHGHLRRVHRGQGAPADPQAGPHLVRAGRGHSSCRVCRPPGSTRHRPHRAWAPGPGQRRGLAVSAVSPSRSPRPTVPT